MTRRLEGKVAIVTGAGRGIGRAEALLFAREGAKVVVNDIGCGPLGEGSDANVAAEVVDEIKRLGGEAAADTSDISAMAGAASLVNKAVSIFARVDILVNNAGVVRPRIIYNMSEEDWDIVINVHLKGHFAMIRQVSPIFRQQKSGVIVNTSSESGLGHFGQASYSAAKEGIVGLTRTVARDLAPYGVRCNAIRPRASTRLASPEALDAMVRFQTQYRMPAMGNRWVSAKDFTDASPEQIAPLVVWLCTDAAKNITGRTLQVGGDEVGIYEEPRVTRSAFRAGGWDLATLDDYFKTTVLGVSDDWRT
jgi:3-oxoacyl-[acyl-carrier protein] reductase